MYILCVVLVHAGLIASGSGIIWYRGCYHDMSNQIGQDGVNVLSEDSPLVGCSKLCAKQRYLFAGVQRGDNCACLNNTNSLSAVNKSFCSQRCSGVAEKLPLWCGGQAQEWSLYHAAGPYLVTLNAQIEAQTIVVNSAVSLDAILEYARYINFTQESDEEWLKSYKLVWRVDGEQFSANVTGYGRKVSSRSVFTFTRAGTIHVEVTASNAISSLTRSFVATVVLPKPQDLQIVPLNDSDYLPSCIPEAYSNLNAIAAFVNITITFEVSVSVGTNLTFILQHGKSDGGTFQEYRSAADCEDLQCQGIIKDYEFIKTGVYVIAATVQNEYGAVHENITVVVMEQRLGDVTFDLHEDSDSSVLQTHEPVRFLVTLETTERQHTFLRVNFGIGEEKKMSLREQKNRSQENDKNVLDDSPSLDGFGLAASYGEGCNLSIIFQYTYVLEGTYMPQIHVSSNVGYLKMALRQDLIIQNELSGPRLQFEEFVMVNRTALFLLYFTKSSVNLSVVWTIFDREKSVVDNFTTSHAQLYYNFTEAGQYELSVTASNRINSVSTVKKILAQTVISGLSITCHPHIYVRRGQEITCTAEIDSGSLVTFEWNFKDMTASKKTDGNLKSTVAHSFHQDGVYYVSVMASNYISRMIAHLEQPVYVEQEIKSVDIFSQDQLVNQKGLFFIRPACKCQVNVQFDFGEGRRNYDMDSTLDPYIYRAYNFTSPGVYNVTVFAFNNISNASNSLQVRVYNPVRRFNIQLQGHAIKGLPTVFVAKSEGQILNRKEFIYRWLFPGQVTRETLIPMAQFVFDDVGTYYMNLTVTVQNMVDSVSQQLEVIVHERAPAGVWVLHSGIVQTYEVVDFSLHDHDKINRLVVNYSDGDLEEYFSKSSWKHAFSEPGVYKVSVTIYGNGTATKLQSYITAQRPIRAVRIEGPSAIKIENDERLYTWTAVPDGGSHPLYIWSINNIAANRTTKSTYTLNTFTRAGIKRLNVQAENDVSMVQASLNLTVQYPILSIQLDIPATPLGTLTNISIIVNGGMNFSVRCHFGDGTVTTSSSQSHNGGVATIRKAHEEKGIPPVYHLVMSHVYADTGVYDVNVTVANLFSAVGQVSRALVDEPISGINMLTNSDTLVQVEEVVTVSVTVASGRDLTFKWVLTDVNSNPIEYYITSEVYSDANTSNVTYIFIVPNKYRVSVIIKSTLYAKPVEATLPKIFHAVQKISSVKLHGDMAAAAVDQKIEFTATIVEEGSDVVYLFDFGDGHTQQSNGTTNLMSHIVGVVSHTYTEVGVYRVSVIAINPLGNVTAVLKPFYVQVPPTLHGVMMLDQKKYCLKLRENITLVARIPHGTNITFNWQLDDETELIDTGEWITHNYRTTGQKLVRVKAYNRVGKIEGFTNVHVFNEIQGVKLSATRDVVGTMERLEYVAIPDPNETGTVEFYNWTFDEHVQTSENHISFAFASPGKHVVTVAANNCISRAVSKPLEIQVMSRLKSLDIHVEGESLVHQPIKFTATFWIGDNLNFTWDFGDDSPVIQGLNETTVHRFNRTGEFIVNLTAVNAISGDSVTVQLFILELICKPPEITIPGTTANMFTFYHSDQVHIETAVKINCSPQEEVTYMWSFSDVEGRTVQPMRTDEDMLDKQTLILSPRSLAPGMYRATVKVKMSKTIVYSTSAVDVTILPTPLKSIIEGGMQRTIGQQETLYLDGSNSRDPDHPHNASLRFNWTCQSLPRYGLCYNITAINLFKANTNDTDIVYDSASSQLLLTSPKVAIPAGFLLQDDSYFLFTLVVSAPDGRQATSDQVIKVKADNQTISLKISCHQCRGGLVNMDEKISLRTECINCPNNLTYTWKISLIENSFSEPEQDYRSDCKPEEASGQLSLVLSVASWIKKTGLTTTSTVPPEAPTSPSIPSSTTRKITESVPRNRGLPGCGQMFNEDLAENTVGDDLHLDLLQEGLSNGRQRPRKADNGVPQVVGEGTSGKRPFGRPQVITSGINEEITESMPRNRGLPGCSQMFNKDPAENKEADNVVPQVVGEGIYGKRPFGRPQHSSSGINEGASSGRDKVLISGKKPSPYKQHISSSPRVPIPLPANQTYTGLDKQSLVIKPGYLPQNWTYVVQVSAKAQGMEASWAEIYFHVNRSPSKGTCSVRPLTGIEMDTQFTVFCLEWKDEHLPLIYEVGYSMGKGQRTSIIYRGASHEINFYMPAGHPSDNYTVLLSVSIRDNFGARTSYCFSPVVVRPKDSRIGDRVDSQQKGNGSFPLELFYKPYQKAKNYGDDRATCTLIGNMATWMNRSPKVNMSSPEWLKRQKTRYRLLDDLLKLPLRDEVEVIQIAQSLAATTAVPQELCTCSLELALRLLESIQTRTEVLYADIADPGEDILTLAIQAVSSIIGASVEQADKQGPRTLTVRAMTVLDKLLQVELNHHSIGEAPIQRSAEFVSVLGSRYTPRLATIISINDAQFKLPSNMAAITQTARKVSPNQKSSSMNAECFQAHMTSFKKNPFSHLGDQIWKVQAEVLALNLYSCDGQNISVKHLPSDAEVFIQIPQQERDGATYSTHVLDKKYMNVHQFNLTRQNLDQPFHISIQLDPVPGRSFPIALLIGQFHHPTPQRYYLRQNFPTGQDNITIFLPAGTFNDSGMYYLGIVDSHYNAGRHREGQVLTRNYTFSLWLDNCLFWDEKQAAWSDKGCQVMEDSTAEQMRCRCNHLTAFGGHIDLVANDLNFIDVDSFFSLHENPVTIVLVCLVFCTYFILLALCRQADIHDEKKGRVVYLTDNGGSDKQQYEVTVETGFRMGAGSTAKISMIIHGEEGMSETRELISDDNRPLFERNSRDKFVMTHPDSLGKIWKVQLWHNNSGPSPSWYLSRVLVRDLVTGHVYYFLCERWFAVEEDDGKVEREVMALDGDIGFSTVFWAKGTQYMADFHLWTSLMTRPAHSRFTRTQRLTCCLTLLMSYMCLNAMWYKQTLTEVRGEFGLLDASWQNVSTGAIICSLIIPLNLLLGFLFRRSRVRYPGSEPDKPEYVSGKPSEEVSREHEEETVQPIMTYSLLDQSILNWQSIQDWAQKQWIKREQAVHSGSNRVKTSHPSSPQTPAPPVLLTLRKEEETDVASSGFEDSTSQAYSQGVADKNRVQPIPSAPSPSPPPRCQDTYHRDQHRLHSSRRVFLPFWCRYIAWTLCAVISVGCAGITVLYGFRFGKTKSTMWLQSLYFSFMMCIFIAQPFLILLTVVYTAMKHRQDPCVLDHYDDGFYGMDNELARRRKQREVECEEWEELERGVAARQRCRYLRFARPPQEKTLIEARKKIIREKKTLGLFSDSVVFSVMFPLLTIMAYGRDTASPFYCNQAIKDAFVNSGQLPFSQIQTRREWFEWSRMTLLDGVYSQSVSVTPSQPHKQMAIGHLNSYLIGDVHVRQLRVGQEDCSSIRYVTKTSPCRYQYSSSRRDNSIVGVNSSWTDPTAYSFLLWGQHGTYDPTGSTIQLSRNRSEAYRQLRELEESSWLDVQTRAVIVELTLFNVPTNLFSSVTLLLEFPPTGGADPYPIVMATRVFCYISVWDNCVLACELVFVVLTLMKIRCELCEIVRNQAKYFNNLWNYLEFTFGLLSLTYVVCYMFRFVLVADIVEDLRNTFYEEFINVSFLALWDEILRAEVGLLLFFVIVKFVPLLRYITVCAKFSNIYRRARKEIILFMALYVFILCAFTGLGVVLFGSVSLGLRNAWFGLWSMTALMVRIHAPPDLEVNSSPWWLIFVFSYLVFGVGLLTSYMVAVMSRRLKVYKQGDIAMMGIVDSIKCLYQRLLLCSGIQRVQPIEEPENVLPPEFTMAEIEYQVDELLFRMNNLAGSSSLPEKPQGYLTDSTDASHGAGDDGISSGGGSEDQAGVGTDRLELRVQKIEDKLYANEPYLAQLLKLDSIGADVLSQEKEKQLRSHLELEIFRQLQLQRQEHGGTTQLLSNQNPGITAALHGRSVERSPSSASNGSHKLPHLELPKTKDLVASLTKPKPKSGASPICPERSRSDVRSPPSLASPSGIHPEAGSSSPESPHNKRSGDTRPKVKVGPPVPPKPVSNLLLSKSPSSRVGKSGKPSSSSENASPQSSESEKVHRRTDSSSGQSGSIERTGSVKQPTIKPELPPKPTFIQTTLDEHAHFDSNKSLSVGSQKQRQFKLPPERVLQRGDLCGNIAAESSSGSEQDAAHFGRRPSGKRNLRKTKSRGKGKGSGGLSPALMLEDLTLDNPEIEDLEQAGMLENVIQEQEL
ncbi:polycystin-1-like protein 1 isoform X2 [Haliotis cracherodii]|uniref:polycystin-1-like protein 1 isoform X2 n=1 Tax=Haliotis cracherodii TaxID=6455 RepID=UPI0039EABECD